MGSQVDPTPELEAAANVHLDQWVVAVAVPGSSPHHEDTVAALAAHSAAMMTRGPEVYALVDLQHIGAILGAVEPFVGQCGIGIAVGACWSTDTPTRHLAGPAVDEARALAKKAGPGGILTDASLAQQECAGLDLTHAAPLTRFWCAGIEGERDLLWLGARQAPTARRAPVSMVEPAFPWVARPHLTRRLTERLRLGGPLVLVGPPGSGKTRTAQRIAWNAAAKGARVVWASLTRMDASSPVNATVHDAFGANLSVAPLDLSGLLDRSSPDLVVLDAAEHCLEEVEHFVQRWATSPRSTRVLITSRRVPTAVDFVDIPPMTSPQARLLTRWVSGGATGPVTARERALIDLCGGQPSALILKAREEMLAAVPGQDAAMANGTNTQPALPSADVARSFTMLSPPVLEGLLQLAVFESPFTEEAARQIVDLQGFRHPPQFDHVMSALREQSLIQPVETPDGIERDSVPFTVRSTALSTLGRSGRRTAVGSRHTKWGIQRGRELAERVRLGDPDALVALSIEAGDFRAIARRRARTGTGEALQALLALVPLKIAQSPLPERVKFLRDAMELAQRAPLDLRSKARRALSEALLAQGKFQEARDSLQLANEEVTKRKRKAPAEGPRIAALRVQLHRLAGEIEEARQIAYVALEQSGDDRISRGSISTELGVLQHAEGELDLALTTLLEAMELLRNEDVPAYCRAAMATGDVLRAQGKGHEAASYYDQAKAHYTAIGERSGRASVLHAIGSLHLDNGKFEAARAAFEEAKAHHVDVGDQRGAALASGNLARLHHVLGDITSAKRQYQDAILSLDEIGDHRFAHIYRANQGTLLHEEGDMEGALEAYQESIQPLLRMGDRRFAAMFLGRKAALEADAGATIEAMHSLEQAERLVGETPDPVLKAALTLHRTHVGLVSGSGVSPLHAAQEAIFASNSPGSSALHSYDVRIAKRLLERSIQAFKPQNRAVPEAIVA